MTSWIFSLLGAVGSVLEQWRVSFSDEQLIALAKQGGEDGKRAFQLLVERHQRWLVALIRHLVSDKSDAEDLAQNVLVKAFFALPKFRQDAKFRTWLRVIATREAFNHYRRRSTTHEVPTDLDERASAHGAEDAQPAAQERLHERDALMQALHKVPYPYREILVLRYIEELELDEIGAALDLGTSATKMRLKRAREFFQSAYAQESCDDHP